MKRQLATVRRRIGHQTNLDEVEITPAFIQAHRINVGIPAYNKLDLSSKESIANYLNAKYGVSYSTFTPQELITKPAPQAIFEKLPPELTPPNVPAPVKQDETAVVERPPKTEPTPQQPLPITNNKPDVVKPPISTPFSAPIQPTTVQNPLKRKLPDNYTRAQQGTPPKNQQETPQPPPKKKRRSLWSTLGKVTGISAVAHSLDHVAKGVISVGKGAVNAVEHIGSGVAHGVADIVTLHPRSAIKDVAGGVTQAVTDVAKGTFEGVENFASAVHLEGVLHWTMQHWVEWAKKILHLILVNGEIVWDVISWVMNSLQWFDPTKLSWVLSIMVSVGIAAGRLVDKIFSITKWENGESFWAYLGKLLLSLFAHFALLLVNYPTFKVLSYIPRVDQTKLLITGSLTTADWVEIFNGGVLVRLYNMGKTLLMIYNTLKTALQYVTQLIDKAKAMIGNFVAATEDVAKIVNGVASGAISITNDVVQHATDDVNEMYNTANNVNGLIGAGKNVVQGMGKMLIDQDFEHGANQVIGGVAGGLGIVVNKTLHLQDNYLKGAPDQTYILPGSLPSFKSSIF